MKIHAAPGVPARRLRNSGRLKINHALNSSHFTNFRVRRTPGGDARRSVDGLKRLFYLLLAALNEIIIINRNSNQQRCAGRPRPASTHSEGLRRVMINFGHPEFLRRRAGRPGAALRYFNLLAHLLKSHMLYRNQVFLHYLPQSGCLEIYVEYKQGLNNLFCHAPAR